MKRFGILLLVCMIGLPLAALAQNEPGYDKMSLGANFELSVPMGDFSDWAGTGYGGNLRYQFGADIRAKFTATAGYMVWSKKDLGANVSVQPKAFNIFLGGKYYLAPTIYGSLEGGLYFVSYTYEGTVIATKGNSTYFMLPIGLGFQKSGFELGARYMILYHEFNQFSFTLGYNFAL